MANSKAASVKQKLLNKAKAENRLFSEILQYYAMERFLVRLSKTEYVNQFVLKGALLLRVIGIGQVRPTRDIDLHSRIVQSQEELLNIFRICCNQHLDDGLIFDPTSVKAMQIRKEQSYQGVNISLMGKLGSATIYIQIDIGFGDVITPEAIVINYPILLEGEPPKIKGYPLETVIAEKFQAMVELDLANSRMKDFYDLWFICTTQPLQGDSLGNAIQQTFKRRKTSLPIDLPTAFTSEFYRNSDKQVQWKAFLRKMGIDSEPTLEEAIVIIAQFLWPLVQIIHKNEVINIEWNPNEGWIEFD